MGHKISKVVFGIFLLAIVVPLVSQVNHLNQIATDPKTAPVLAADGNPGPPLPPPTDLGLQSGTNSVLMADGNPGPPLPPPTGLGLQVAEPVIIADGNPGPPLPPPPSKMAQIGSEYAV